jgi:hypothetical protein
LEKAIAEKFRLFELDNKSLEKIEKLRGETLGGSRMD